MTVKITDPDTGEENEYYTADEIQAAEAAKTAAETAAAESNAKYENLNKLHSSQAENFKRYKDMSEDEKSALSAEKTETLKRIEAAEDIANKANAKLAEKETAEAETKKNSLVSKYTGNDKDLAAKFTEKYDGLESIADPEQRAVAAAALAGIGVNVQVNPLHQRYNGEGPQASKAKTERDEFLASDKGQAGLAAMGMAQDKK